MRTKGSKGKNGKMGICPKCQYQQNVKTKLILVGCSSCGLKSKRGKWKLKQ